MSTSQPPNRAGGQPTPQLDDPFVRFDARILDPATASRLPDQPIPAATAYVGDTIMVTATDLADARAKLTRLDGLKADTGLELAGPSPLAEVDRGADGIAQADIAAHNRLARLLQLADQAGLPLVFPARLRVTAAGATPAIDVWPLLQRLRAAGEGTSYALDHLLFPAVRIGGNPVSPHGTSVVGGVASLQGTAFIGGNPVSPHGTSVAGIASYVQPGSGGRAPVSVVLVPPTAGVPPTGTSPADPPVVVVLDTGCGAHPWFSANPVVRDLKLFSGDSVGLDPADPDVMAHDPEAAGSVPDPMTGLLATHAGHGTFIAGLLRQRCPEATIIGLRLMDADGVVPSSRLTTSLTALLGWIFEQGEKAGRVDALVLSLGYYPETPDDANYSTGLLVLLVELSRRGVTTFAAAGNDASSSRYYPAAFSDSPAFGDNVPVVAVRALNPDGTAALFSNDGPWVRGEAPGANVVSTTPIDMDGAIQADVVVDDATGRRRSTIDPDEYSSGFSIWSGTSFAAPALAGEMLAALVGQTRPLKAAARVKILEGVLVGPAGASRP